MVIRLTAFGKPCGVQPYNRDSNFIYVNNRNIPETVGGPFSSLPEKTTLLKLEEIALAYEESLAILSVCKK